MWMLYFLKKNCCSNHQFQEIDFYFFKPRSRGLTGADPWNIIQGSGTDYDGWCWLMLGSDSYCWLLMLADGC